MRNVHEYGKAKPHVCQLNPGQAILVLGNHNQYDQFAWKDEDGKFHWEYLCGISVAYDWYKECGTEKQFFTNYVMSGNTDAFVIMEWS